MVKPMVILRTSFKLVLSSVLFQFHILNIALVFIVILHMAIILAKIFYVYEILERFDQNSSFVIEFRQEFESLEIFVALHLA